jgi:hypothetical protein
MPQSVHVCFKFKYICVNDCQNFQGAKPDEPQGPKELRLPQALEKVLAFKDVRAEQVGVKPEEMAIIEKGNFYEFKNIFYCGIFLKCNIRRTHGWFRN